MLKDGWGLDLSFWLLGLCQRWSHPFWRARDWLSVGAGVMESHVGSASLQGERRLPDSNNDSDRLLIESLTITAPIA